MLLERLPDEASDGAWDAGCCVWNCLRLPFMPFPLQRGAAVHVHRSMCAYTLAGACCLLMHRYSVLNALRLVGRDELQP